MKTYGREKTKSGKDKELMSYCCPWCGYEFKQYVYKAGHQGEFGKKGDWSDQVVCKQCGNTLKTWD